MDIQNKAAPTGLQIISPVFREGCPIPKQYTCKGSNVNPPLNFFNIPPQAQSLALIMHDPDAPGGDFTHWLVWDMPANTETVPAHSVPVGAIQGLNGQEEIGYTGPCPPKGTGTHRYIFELYALDTTLGLDGDCTRQQLEAAMKNHILSESALSGVFAAES